MRILPHGQQAPKQSAADKDQQVLRAQLQSLRVKLDSQLLVNNLMKVDAARQACAQLDAMSTEQRQQYITEKWGPLYMERAVPLLLQIEQTEAALARLIPPAQQSLPPITE